MFQSHPDFSTQFSSAHLAGLLCSRLCHDLINPVSILSTALSLLDDPSSQDMHDEALDLVRLGIKQTTEKLDFARMAFGASGSDARPVASSEIKRMATIALANNKINVQWRFIEDSLPKGAVRLFLNLCLIGSIALARGGLAVLEARKTHKEGTRLCLELSSPTAGLGPEISAALQGQMPYQTSDGRLIQAYYTGLMAHEAGARFECQHEDGRFVLRLLIPAKKIQA